MANYPDGTEFGDYQKFEEGSTFGSICNFGDACEFGDACNFGENCEFGDSCKFSFGCEFQSPTFGNGCEVLVPKLNGKAKFGRNLTLEVPDGTIEAEFDGNVTFKLSGVFDPVFRNCRFGGDVKLAEVICGPKPAIFEGGRVDGILSIEPEFDPQILFRGVLFASPLFAFPADERVSLENCFVCANERTATIIKDAFVDDWDLNVLAIIAQFRGREEHDGN